MFLELLDTKCVRCSGSVMWEDTLDGKAMRCTKCNHSQIPYINPDVGIPDKYLSKSTKKTGLGGIAKDPFIKNATWKYYVNEVKKLGGKEISKRKSPHVPAILKYWGRTGNETSNNTGLPISKTDNSSANKPTQTTL